MLQNAVLYTRFLIFSVLRLLYLFSLTLDLIGLCLLGHADFEKIHAAFLTHYRKDPKNGEFRKVAGVGVD